MALDKNSRNRNRKYGCPRDIQTTDALAYAYAYRR